MSMPAGLVHIESNIKARPSCSLVIPVYKNEASIPELLAQIEMIARGTPGDFEAVFVVDGSPDLSYALLAKLLPTATFASKLILLSRNFGSFAAIIAGMGRAEGDYFAVMAADLQDPPETILRFFELLAAGDVDVTLGIRKSRCDPQPAKVAAQLFWWFYRKSIQKEMPDGGLDIFGCSRSVRDALLCLKEQNSSLVGLLLWVGFRRAHVDYERRLRPHGKSAWTFSRKVTYMMDSAFAFTDLPVRLCLMIGGTALVFSVIYVLIIFIATMMGKISQPGFPTLAGMILGFGAANLFAIGLVGSYAWRVFENTKGRPKYIIQSEQENEGVS